MVRDHLTNVEEFCVNPGSAGEPSKQTATQEKKLHSFPIALQQEGPRPQLDLAIAVVFSTEFRISAGGGAGSGEWPCEYAMPSVPRSDPNFYDNSYWRGRIW